MNTILFRSLLVAGFGIYFALFAADGIAQSTISGILTESVSGEVIIGATVRLAADSSATTVSARGAITNKFGFYSIPGVAPGEYVLSTRAIGYQPVVKRVSIVAGEGAQRIDLVLPRQDVRGQEVVVEAEKEGSATRRISAVDVRPEFIQQLPALGGEVDIFRALQLLPGVKAGSEISSGLYVRGGSPDQNLTLLDGVTIYNPSHLGGFLSTFNSDAIRDIRLIKGAFPAEYGGRLSSVLDLTMREGTEERVKGTAGVSLINSRLTLEGPLVKGSTWMFSARRLYLDLLTLAAPADEPVPTYYFYDLNGKINFKLSESDRLFLSGYRGRDVFGIPLSESTDSVFSDINWGNSAINARWMHIMSPEVFTNFSAIYTDYVFNALIENRRAGASDRDNFKSVSGVRDLMLRGEVQYFPSEDHILRAGIEATQHRFRADASAQVQDFTVIESHPSIINSFDGSFYAQDEWKWGSRLSGNLGARMYYFQNGDYLRFEPRIGASYALTDDISVKAAFAQANQFLHLIVRNDIALPTDVWFPSTKTIKPSESSQGVLGLETYLFDKELVFTVEGYYKTLKNVYEFTDTASFSLDVPLESSFTAGNGKAYGIELFLNKRVGSFTGWIGYTLAWTKRTFPALNYGREFYPRYDRRHDVAVVLTYRLGKSWEFGATWVYGTGQAYTVPTGQYTYADEDIQFGDDRYYTGSYQRLDYTERNNYRIPAFHKLDLNFTNSFEWFGLPWQFSINIYNAYNHRNVFAQELRRNYNGDSFDSSYDPKYKIVRYTLFPIIPTFGLSCKF